MANWCNLRLSVFGPPDEFTGFRAAAGPLEGHIDARRRHVFLPEMEVGEVADLTAEKPEVFGRRFQRAEYRFQGRGDDHVDHFRRISRRYPQLAFVLTFSDPNGDSHGSYRLLNGTQRTWDIPVRLYQELMRKHRRRGKAMEARGRVDYESEESDMAESDAFFEMMDIAAAHWNATILDWLRKQHPARRSSAKR